MTGVGDGLAETPSELNRFSATIHRLLSPQRVMEGRALVRSETVLFILVLGYLPIEVYCISLKTRIRKAHMHEAGRAVDRKHERSDLDSGKSIHPAVYSSVTGVYQGTYLKSIGR